jgi:hypothetical protein
MAVAVTNSTILLYDTEYTVTANAATADVADLVEVFTITPTAADHDVLIKIDVGPTNGAVAYSVAAGALWAGSAALTGSVAQDTSECIVLTGGKYRSATGTYVITFTPASGKKLLTDHAMSAEVIEMP